ncbi:hypothetical protein BJV82DRAFT_577010 [Fennellomyces sp. T-0311]|nr:hypothetical protein BJV82DRAFT_577010 [Fennellomyces sp. T-0311]
MTVDQSIFEYTNYLSFIDLFESQVARHHERVFTLYQLPNTPKLEFRTLTYGQFDSITTCLADEWSSQLETVQRVGILTGVSVQSFLAMLVVLKLGKIFFPISTGNSETTITELLASTDTQFLIASGEYRQIAQSCTRELPVVSVKIWELSDLERLAIPSFSYHKRNYWPVTKPNDIVIIIQSSGTTGHPKPIYLDNQWLVIQTLNSPIQRRGGGIHSSEPCIERNDTLLSTSAAFHAFGLAVYLTPLMIGAKVFIFHKLPPCTEDLLAAAAKSNATIMTTSPANLEALVKYIHTGGDNEFTIGVLKQLKFCLCSGAPLSLDVRNALQFKGLKIQCGYGSTAITHLCALVLLTDGGKTDPLMLEMEIGKSRLVESCIVVGHNKRQTAVLVELDVEQSSCYQPDQIVSEVQAANLSAAQAHSVISVPDMIYILPPNRKLPVTSKGTIARKEAVEQFEKEIDGMYLYIFQGHSELPITSIKGTIPRKETLKQFEKEIDELHKSFENYQ